MNKTLAILVIVSTIAFTFQNALGLIGVFTIPVAVVVAVIVLVRPSRV